MITTGFVILVRRDGNLLPQHQVYILTVCRYNSLSLYYVYIYAYPMLVHIVS